MAWRGKINSKQRCFKTSSVDHKPKRLLQTTTSALQLSEWVVCVFFHHTFIFSSPAFNGIYPHFSLHRRCVYCFSFLSYIPSVGRSASCSSFPLSTGPSDSELMTRSTEGGGGGVILNCVTVHLSKQSGRGRGWMVGTDW